VAPNTCEMNIWSRIPERGSQWGMRFFMTVARSFGYWPGIMCLAPVIAVEMLSNPRARRASRKYLTRIGYLRKGASVSRSLAACYRHQFSFAVNIYDRLWFWQNRMEKFRFEFEGREALDSIKNRGAMIVSAHIGSFDLLRLLAAREGSPVSVVMYGAASEKITRFFGSLGSGFNLRVLRADKGMETVWEIQRQIDEGGLVALLADRHPPGDKRSRQIDTLFFDEAAPFPSQPWMLAGLIGCPVVFAVAERIGWRHYRIVSRVLTEKLDFRRPQRAQTMAAITRDFSLQLEERCRKSPFQWFNFFDFWNPV
jgi:predicted LPLAT superfamily acyltransferase